MNPSTHPPPTHRASFVIRNERAATRAADALGEILAEGGAAVTAFARGDGRWAVTVHFAQPPDEPLVRAQVTRVAGTDVARTVVFDTLDGKDWVKASLEDLVPVPAGRFVVHGRHDRARVGTNKLSIEIEAALAFGTGHHGTTRGSLLLLDHVLKGRRIMRVLDLGTGTGVLAIAAAKALRHTTSLPINVLASDIDATAVGVARENARLNGVGRRVRVIRAVGFSASDFRRDGPFDLVLSNILANPLKALAGEMPTHLAPSARLILSGLLTPQAGEVIAAYRARGLVPLRHVTIEGWTSLLLTRPSGRRQSDGFG